MKKKESSSHCKKMRGKLPIDSSSGGLVHVIFSWSLDDIENENLFQVKQIDERSISVQHYLGSFKLLLSKENRAQLLSSMGTISEAPYAEVISFSEIKPYETMSYEVKVGKSCSMCLTESDEKGDEKLAMSLRSRLNESQTQAILSCLGKIRCDHMSCLELVWGPPGTGKTKTISTMNFTLVGKKCQTLTCVPSNIAITEIACRVLKLVMESHEIGYGTNASFYPLGDILLFGNKERLKVTSELEEIYLDYRVKRLKECFTPITSWWNCFMLINIFLMTKN